MKLTAPQRACLAYYLWLETREGPKPKWSQDTRVTNTLLDRQLLTGTWGRDAKLGYDVKKITVTDAGKVAMAES